MSVMRAVGQSPLRRSI